MTPTATRNGHVVPGTRIPCLRPLVPEPGQTVDQLVADDHLFLQMGPAHPAMHGTVRMNLEVDGENLIGVDVEIGYLHRGFEKMCEQNNYTQCIPYTDRLNYVSPLINNVGFAMAVEKLLDVELPPRGQWIRTLGCEISRISDHLTCLGAASMEVGAFSVFLYYIEAREEVWECIEALCGARLTTTWTRVGGLMADLPEGFDTKCRETVKKVRALVEDGVKLLARNRIFYDRLKDIGVISAEEAIALSFGGPCLRGSGVDYDVRRAAPYLTYEQLDWEVPLGENGDNYDRFYLRLQEIEQSCRMIEQCLDKMPGGPINSDDPKVTFPDKGTVYNSIEGLIHHFNVVVHGVRPPKGEVYQAVEGGNGELGFYLVSDGTEKPVKCRCRPPCFPMVQGLPVLLRGAMIADIIPTFGLVNMIGGELDR